MEKDLLHGLTVHLQEVRTKTEWV